MSNLDKRLIEVYRGTTIEDKYEAYYQLLVLYQLKGIENPEEKAQYIQDTLTPWETGKWAYLHAMDMRERLEWFKMCLKREQLAHLRTEMHGLWGRILMSSKKGAAKEDCDQLREIREDLPFILKDEGLWKPEYDDKSKPELFREYRWLREALEEMTKRMNDLSYSKKTEKRVMEAHAIMDRESGLTLTEEKGTT